MKKAQILHTWKIQVSSLDEVHLSNDQLAFTAKAAIGCIAFSMILGDCISLMTLGSNVFFFAIPSNK